MADAFLTRYIEERTGPENASYLQCEAFLDFDWLDHAFGTKHSTGWLAAHPAVTLRQIHSDHVFRVNGFTDRQCEGDALITDQIGQRVGVRTADCVPLLIADPANHAVAAIHAGWRGTVALIAAKAVGHMEEEFGSRPENLHVAIGPAVRVCCYEVGPEVVIAMAPLFPEWSAHPVALGAVHRKVDLVEANRRALAESGVPLNHIYDGGFCTMCRPDLFHSYRHDPKDPGRMVSSIVKNR